MWSLGTRTVTLWSNVNLSESHPPALGAGSLHRQCHPSTFQFLHECRVGLVAGDSCSQIPSKLSSEAGSNGQRKTAEVIHRPKGKWCFPFFLPPPSLSWRQSGTKENDLLFRWAQEAEGKTTDDQRSVRRELREEHNMKENESNACLRQKS